MSSKLTVAVGATLIAAFSPGLAQAANVTGARRGDRVSVIL